MWGLFKSFKMGHTFRKEKSIDDYKKNYKKIMVKDIERKQTKNKKIIEFDQEFDDDDFEDEYNSDFANSIDDEKNNYFTKNRK